MAVTPTTDRGWFDYLSNLDAMVDYDYASTVVIDDLDAVWRTSKWLMSTEGQSRKTDTPIFYLWDGELGDRVYTLNGAHTTGDLTLTLDSTAGMIGGMVLQAQSSTSAAGRFMRITSVDSSTVVTVTVISGDSNLADNQELRVIGTAQTQNATSGIDDSFVYPEAITNRVQLIQRAVEWTKTELATKLRAESAIQQKHTQGRAEYEKDLDGVVLSSSISVDTTNRFQTSNGVIPLILGTSAAPKVDAGGDALAYADITGALVGIMQYAPQKDLLGLCGTSAIKQFAELGTSTSTYESKPGDNIYGFSGEHFQMGQFKVHLVFERMLKELGGAYNNYIVIISGKNWQVRHLPGLKFEWKRNFQDTKSSQVIRSQWESHIGVGANHVKTNAIIHNLLAA